MLLDKVDGDWSYVVLGPDEQRSFRAIAQHVSMESQDVATSELTEKMQELLANGETVFPQAIPGLPPKCLFSRLAAC